MHNQLVPLGHGQVAVTTGYSKHAKFDQFNNHIGRYTTKQTNQKRKKK